MYAELTYRSPDSDIADVTVHESAGGQTVDTLTVVRPVRVADAAVLELLHRRGWDFLSINGLDSVAVEPRWLCPDCKGVAAASITAPVGAELDCLDSDCGWFGQADQAVTAGND